MTSSNNNSKAAGNQTYKRRADDPRVAVPDMSKVAAARNKAASSGNHSASSSQDKKAINGNSKPTVNGNSKSTVNGNSANQLAGQLGSLQLSGQAGAFQPRAQDPYYKQLLQDSQPEHAAPVIVSSTGNGKSIAKSQSPIGTRPDGKGHEVAIVFSTDADFVGGRYLMINGIKDGKDFDDGMNRITTKFEPKADIVVSHHKLVLANNPQGPSTAFIAFDDLRVINEFQARMDAVKGHWQAKRVGHHDYISAAPASIGNPYHDGQVLIECQPKDGMPLPHQDQQALVQDILALARSFGEVLAFEQDPAGLLLFHAEYYKLSDARELLKEMDIMCPAAVGDYYAIATAYGSPPESDDGHSNGTPYFASSATHSDTSPTGRTNWVPGPNGHYVAQKPPYTLPRMQVHSDFLDEVAYQPGQQFTVFRQGVPAQGYFNNYQAQPPMPAAGGHGGHGGNGGRGGYGGGYGGGNGGRRFHGPLHNFWGRQDHNRPNVDRTTEPQYIHVDKVYNGRDVRTTVMLRNIPNKWTCHDLKGFLDYHCPGEYDFSYLRIDFENNTNVGYGFVNFIDAQSIAKLMEAMSGLEWEPGHRPYKRFEASYATIQGLDCLIEKFRNSSVISENPDYRPMLWYTRSDAPSRQYIGRVKPFPPPNNMSKRQRSHDNAATVGLFAPRSSHRGNQGRRSVWDRGTSRQMREDAYFQTYTTAPPPPPPGPGYFGPPYGWFPPYPQQYYHPAAPHFPPPAMPPPYPPQYYQAGAANPESVPRTFSEDVDEEEEAAAAPRGGPGRRGNPEKRRY